MDLDEIINDDVVTCNIVDDRGIENELLDLVVFVVSIGIPISDKV